MAEGLHRTPLYEEHVLMGGRMVSFAGYELPVQCAGIVEEHRAVRSSAGVFDVSHMAQFRVFGFGAFELLQGLLTNDLALISELGSAQYTLLCDEDGGIIDDLIVYHTGDLEYLVVANAGNRGTDWDWLVGHCPSHLELVHHTDRGGEVSECTVEFVDESDRTAMIALQGPKALDVLAELAEPGYRPPPRFEIGEAALGGIPALVARTGYTGEDGVEILTHASRAAEMWRVLLSFAEVTPCGLGARDTLRLEMGYALHGSDIDRGVDPISARLGWAVAKDKDYIGREAIERVREQGPQRRLIGLTVEGGIPRPGFAILHEGDEVGKVASGTFSPTLQTGIATAYLPTQLAEEGTRLEVSIRKKTASATVTKPPFVKETSLSATQA